MSAYAQFGYTYATPTPQLLVGQGGTTTGSGGCCEGCRAIVTDPSSGQTVCSCQYDRLTTIGSYSRLGSGLGATGGLYGTTYPTSEQNPYPSIGVDSSAFYSPLGSGYSMKDGSTGDVSSMYGTGLGASPAGYYPYDATFAAYGYGPGYDLAARRKNATRESTATLKAWLNEHKKNPYPTKGEKIMLAIITKMTLTQVSTWFANARRRLKKENKMTWEPRNKTDDDDAKLSDDDDDEKEPGDKDDDDIKKDEKEDATMAETKVEDSEGQTELKSCDGGTVSKTVTAALSPTPVLLGSPFSVSKGEKSDCAVSLPSSKPKIWSLADTAACKTPPPTGAVPGVGAGWLAGGTTFPLPATIPPAQHQYSRFSHLMSGVNASQYMSGYSEAVGTDTPPQTPPNANKGAGSNPANQAGLLNVANQSSMLNAVGFLGSNGQGSYGQNLSSCSRGSSGNISAGNSAGGSVENALHQRYNSGVALPSNPSGASNAVLQVSAFSNLYKGQSNNQQGGNGQQNNGLNSQQQSQQGQSLQQQPQQANPQQQIVSCQQSQQPSTVTGTFVS